MLCLHLIGLCYVLKGCVILLKVMPYSFHVSVRGTWTRKEMQSEAWSETEWKNHKMASKCVISTLIPEITYILVFLIYIYKNSTEITVRTRHGTMDWFQGKGVCQGCMLSPFLFNLYSEYIMWNAGLHEAQAGIKIARRNSNNLRYADDTILLAESKEELKSLLIKVKDESEKAGLKLNIQGTKIMESSLITSWQIDGEMMETVRNYFGGLKITKDGGCSHEIKRCLLLGRKAMTNLDSMLKSRDIALLTKVHLIKAMVFPVVTHGCKSWTIKKPEYRRIDAFELWCWRRLLRVPWTVRRSNQSILKEISPEYSLEETPILWPPDVKNWLIGKDSDAGKDWRQEEKETTDDEMVGWHHQLNVYEFK